MGQYSLGVPFQAFGWIVAAVVTILGGIALLYSRRDKHFRGLSTSGRRADEHAGKCLEYLLADHPLERKKNMINALHGARGRVVSGKLISLISAGDDVATPEKAELLDLLKRKHDELGDRLD